MPGSSTVSLCMIVKDEEAVLAGAINPVKHLVDEIIVVDTGSNDGTVEVASNCGAKVIEFPWEDDFAAARNASLAAAGCDWILVLDADEVLEPVDSAAFGQLLADPEVAGYELTLKNLGQERDFALVRLFRNDPAVRYKFPIHEQVTPSLNDWAETQGMRIATSPLVILHSGYKPEQVQAKKPRNRKLLGKALEANPDEPYLHFQRGAEDLSVFGGEVLPVAGMKVATASLEQAWALGGSGPWLPELAALLGSARLVLGDAQGALEVLSAAASTYPEHPRLALPLCLAALELGRQETEAMIGLAGDIAALAITLDDPSKRRILGEMEVILGNPQLARQHFQAALDVDPGFTFAWSGLARACLSEGRHQESLGHFVKAVAASEWNWRAWLQGAGVMQKMGLSDQAGQWRATFSAQFPDHPAYPWLSSS